MHQASNQKKLQQSQSLSENKLHSHFNTGCKLIFSSRVVLEGVHSQGQPVLACLSQLSLARLSALVCVLACWLVLVAWLDQTSLSRLIPNSPASKLEFFYLRLQAATDGEAKISIAIVGIVPLPYHKSVENIFLHHCSVLCQVPCILVWAEKKHMHPQEDKPYQTLWKSFPKSSWYVMISTQICEQIPKLDQLDLSM